MDGSTTFRLEAQPSPLLSRLGCDSDENVKDARHQLRRCATDADYGRWARTWGENLCAVADEHTSCEEASLEDLKAAENDAEQAEQERDELKAAVEAHIREMDRVLEGAAADLIDRVNDSIAKLENAL